MIGKIPPVHWPNVQKVLPAVYGDELSYYELLAKMEKLVNDLIAQANAVGVEVNEFEEALGNIENIDDIEAQVQALQEQANTIQEILESIPNKTLGFVTPEEFGAIGDGITDDTSALQSCIDYAKANKKGILLNAMYGISSALQISAVIPFFGTNNSSGFIAVSVTLDAFIVYDNRVHGYDSASFDNVKFNANRSTAVGIKFNNSFIMCNRLEHLEFYGFKRPCIQLFSDGSGEVLGSVYAHNIQWKNIMFMDCSSYIAQSGDRAPYILGGKISNIMAEGPHVPDGELAYINLKGFRNCIIENIITEGAPQEKKREIIYMNYQNRIESFYVEFPTSSSSYWPQYTVNIENAGFSITQSIRNYYGNLYAPFKLSNINLVVSTGGTSNLNSIVGYGKQLSDDSVKSTLTFEDSYFGGNFNLQAGNRIISGCNVAGPLKLQTGVFMSIDSTPPIVEFDLSQISKSTQGQYGTLCYVSENTGYADNTIVEHVNDYSLGTILRLSTTSPDNHLRCALVFTQANIYRKSNRYTIVITCKPNANTNPEATYMSNSASTENNLIFGDPHPTKDVPVTLVYGVPYYAGGLSRIQIDDFTKDVSVPQSYDILSIAIFDGYCYGNCKSKLFSLEGQ